MEKKNIDALILTENHLKDDFQNILPRNQLFIHHKTGETTPSRKERRSRSDSIARIEEPVEKWKE
jgi:hypothetical protein